MLGMSPSSRRMRLLASGRVRSTRRSSSPPSCDPDRRALRVFPPGEPRGRSRGAHLRKASRRVDTALTRGRCGLWDWDIARGRIYWSHSMYEILGLRPRDEFMSFGEATRLIHPDDSDLYAIADDRRRATSSRSITSSACATPTATGSGCGRAPKSSTTSSTPAHLIGIAMDVTEQRRLAERNGRSRQAPARRHRSTSEAFVLWDAENRLVLCNSKFQETPRSRPTTAHARQAPADGEAAGDAGRSSSGASRRASGGGRAHLRGAARRRALAADQRAPHPRRRLGLRRHGHHPAQAQPGAPARIAQAADGDDQRSRRLAQEARSARPANSPSSTRDYQAEKDRAEAGKPGEVGIPRQYEPRAAHAAERHHRLLRDAGDGHVRAARLDRNTRNMPRHPRQRQAPARRDQRHPRHVEDRGRADWRSSARASTSRRSSRRRVRLTCDTGREEEHPDRAEHRAGTDDERRPPRHEAGPAEPALQRGEVHRGGRPDRGRARGACRTPSS